MTSMQGNRLLVVWAAVFVIVLGALVLGGLAIRKSALAIFVDEAQIRDTRGQLFTCLKNQLDEETSVRGYAVTRQSEFLEPYTTARETMPVSINALEGSLQAQHLQTDLSAIQDAARVNSVWVQTVAIPVMAGRRSDAVALQLRGKGLVDQFRVDISIVDHDLSVQYAMLGSRSQDEVSNLTGYVLIAGGVLLAAAVVFTVFQFRNQRRLEHARRQTEDARRREETARAAYQAEWRVAQSLQEAIKQRELPVIPSIALSATYVPAQDEEMVGGDWYDAFDIGGGRVFFTIGDIAGHGIDAAVAMSRVRSSVLSAALRDVDPASVLARINREQCAGRDWPLVTAIVGVADSKSFEFHYASAGQPPPILLEPGAQPRSLELGSLPLGASTASVYTTHRIRSAPGAMLVLYTDGVVEQTRNVIEGERTLLRAVEELTPDRSTDPAGEIYRGIFGARAGADDVAILTVAFAVERRDSGARSGADGRDAADYGLLRSSEAEAPDLDSGTAGTAQMSAVA